MKTKKKGRIVHHEPAEFKRDVAENCSECGTPTRFWLDPHTPLCKECAKSEGKGI